MLPSYTTGQAGTQTQQISGVPAAYATDAQELARAQRLAQMLSSQKPAEGQMVSGRYVAPSWTQNLAQLVNAGMGAYYADKAETQGQALANKIREGEAASYADFMQTKQGRPAIAGTPDIPTETYETVKGTPAQAAMPANPQAAYANMYFDPRSTAQQKQFAFQKMNAEPEAFTLAADSSRFITLPDGTTKEIASGTRKPIQIDTGTHIEFRDANDISKVLQRIPKAQAPTAGQVVEREDGTYLIDTRSGQARPILGPNGQPLMGAPKSLTESQGKASAFQSQMVSANNVINKLESQGFDPTSLKSQTAVKLAGGAANPVVPVTAQQYKQAQNQWSEAFLRFKTGAAATEPEVVLNNRTFFPVFGDKPDQIAQKADMREQAERDIGIAAGRGANLGAKAIGQQPKQDKVQLNPQDKEALIWAKSNPNDPRSAQIKQRLGQ